MIKIKTMSIITIFLLIGLVLTPLTSSNEIIEQTQSSNTLINTSKSEIEDTKTDLINEEELNLLIKYLSDILPLDITSGITFDEIINIIKNMLDNNPTLTRKTLIISQGWSYNTNFLKNTRLQIKHNLFHLWHYTQASKKGRESKTFIIKPNELIPLAKVELYSGAQTGFMFRPLGFYCFQKNTFPRLSYTLFIGFTSYVFISAQEQIQLPFPFSLP